MWVSGIILGLMVAVHTTARPIDGHHSSLAQDKTLDYRTVGETEKPPALLLHRATQSCHITDHYFWASYSIWIGVPFISPQDCDDTYHAIQAQVHSVSNWQCVPSGGYIQLWFNIDTFFHDQGGWIDNVLHARYPSVDSFNCGDAD